MANLPLAFAELLGGGVLLAAGISGQSVQDVFGGNLSLKSFDTGGDGTAGAGTASGAPAAGADAANPFAQAKSFKLGRVDQGVDASMAPGSPILAPLPSTVVGVVQNWYRGQPAVFFRAADGRFWYLAEQISPTVKRGDTVAAGEKVATYAPHGTGIEIGWAHDAANTLARVTTGYREGQATPAGQSFLHFLQSVGATG